jgi:hypothetical protein
MALREITHTFLSDNRVVEYKEHPLGEKILKYKIIGQIIIDKKTGEKLSYDLTNYASDEKIDCIYISEKLHKYNSTIHILGRDEVRFHLSNKVEKISYKYTIIREDCILLECTDEYGNITRDEEWIDIAKSFFNSCFKPYFESIYTRKFPTKNLANFYL